MVDAGSTGTRVYIYEEKTDELVACYKIWPGLTDFHVYEASIQNYLLEQYLQNIVDFARKYHVNRLDLYGTAGFRILEDNSYIEKIERYLKGLDIPGTATILTGQEEAKYGWVALNHMTGTLDRSFGFMDLGRGSFQVAYEE